MVEGTASGERAADAVDFVALRKRYTGAWISNNGYGRAKAESALAAGHADLVAFGRPFIANPDLVWRLVNNAPLNEPDKSTFFYGEERGFTDYPYAHAASAT
jgi:N-ethylmaleimide reductase